MTALHLALLTIVLLAGLSAYGLRRAPAPDVHRVVEVCTRAVVVLGLGDLAVLLVDPTDIPAVLRAVLTRF
ncbi:hypothetical protein GCM10022244_29320 [Streptomyces gulbargensis]|uniref:Uncharacterized protein n=1 Tax=Streptomyces gulbargensis TaxID=364901 RepID=A0ABP7M9D4_9ACTN